MALPEPGSVNPLEPDPNRTYQSYPTLEEIAKAAAQANKEVYESTAKVDAETLAEMVANAVVFRQQETATSGDTYAQEERKERNRYLRERIMRIQGRFDTLTQLAHPPVSIPSADPLHINGEQVRPTAQTFTMLLHLNIELCDILNHLLHD